MHACKLIVELVYLYGKYRAETLWHSDLQRNPHTLSDCSTGSLASRKAMQYSWLGHCDTLGRMVVTANMVEVCCKQLNKFMLSNSYC